MYWHDQSSGTSEIEGLLTINKINGDTVVGKSNAAFGMFCDDYIFLLC